MGCSFGAKAFLWFNLHPHLASAYACSIPSIVVGALTFWSVLVCVRDCNILTIELKIVLCGWLSCIVGCLTWVFSRYRTLRQFVNIWVVSSQYVVVRNWRVWCMAIIYAHRMFCNPNNLLTMFRSLMGL